MTLVLLVLLLFFFFNDTATTEIYTLSLHDALPIWDPGVHARHGGAAGRHPHPQPLRARLPGRAHHLHPRRDRKSTRLNSSHANISYAVFCLKKKKNTTQQCKSSLQAVTATYTLSTT